MENENNGLEFEDISARFFQENKPSKKQDKKSQNAEEDQDSDLPQIEELYSKRELTEIKLRAHQINGIDWTYLNKNDNLCMDRGLCAKAYHRKHDGNLIYCQQSFWRYNGKIWEQLEDKAVEADIRGYIETGMELGITAATIQDVFTQATQISYCEKDFDMLKHLICMKNGVLDTEKVEVYPHNRDYLQTVLLNYNYDPEAKCPTFSRFLKWLEFTPGTIDRLQEWYGYSLTTETLLELCLFIHGDGDNGKSVLLDTLVAILGEGTNTSSIEPKDLFERFNLVGLKGKLANICTDIETKVVFSAQFKKIVSGEPATVDVKFKNLLTFRPIAKHIFSANNLIVTKDKSHGFFRRFDVLEFEKKIAEKDKDKTLKRKIKDNELSGVFNWALHGLLRLKKNNWVMTAGGEFTKSHNEFKRDSDLVALFLDEKCEEIPNGEEDLGITATTFRGEYASWCLLCGYKPLSSVPFGKELKRLGVKKRRLEIKGKKFPAQYFGFKITNE